MGFFKFFHDFWGMKRGMRTIHGRIHVFHFNTTRFVWSWKKTVIPASYQLIYYIKILEFASFKELIFIFMYNR